MKVAHAAVDMMERMDDTETDTENTDAYPHHITWRDRYRSHTYIASYADIRTPQAQHTSLCAHVLESS